MATRKQIQQALQHPYDRVLFAKEVLHPVFGAGFKLMSTPSKPRVAPTKTESAVIDKVSIYANIELGDSTEITCYEILLQPSVRIEQSKVAIQQYVRKLLLTGQAALINFVSHVNKDIWRFTLVAKDSAITDKGVEETETHPKRYTYLVERERPNRTMAERMEVLSLAPDKNIEALIDAFSVEKMSKAFFDEYKQHYDNFNEYLKGSPYLKSVFNGDEKEARDYVKKLMGRIIFLYFVQKKRWLGATTTEYKDGSYDFIFHLFKKIGGDENFFPIGLSKLFFEALNEHRPDDNWETPWGDTVKIPFLNGGLFVRDEIDELIHRKGDALTFPANLFSDIDKKESPNDRGFLDFLNAYNFTVYEDSMYDHTVAVDPEMLGHIFENLLEDNKDKGAFYTPKEIVHYMCQESLIEYLTTNLGKEFKVYRQLANDQIEIFGNETRTGQLKMVDEMGVKALNRADVESIVKEKDISKLTKKQLKRIDELLNNVKICDPAIGSGAFPMGLLLEIFTIKETIALHLEQEWQPAKAKEEIIQNSIYGVDIEKGAVDIARLRFWLSLVVDEDQPKALPDLDFKIVSGNSLVSKFEDEVIEIDWDIEPGQQTKMFGNEQVLNRQDLLYQISQKQKAFFDPDNGKNKNKLKLEVRNLKIDILINQLQLMINTSGQQDNPKRTSYKKASSFKKAMDKHLETKGWKKTIDKLKALKKEPEKPFDHFDWNLDFPEVLNPYLISNEEERGFDIVIANPPYLKERDNAHIFKIVNESEFGRKWHQGKMDYWFYFLHKAIDINKSEGNIAFITSRYWLNSQGAKKLINRVKQELSFSNVVDIGKLKVFDNVAGHHMIAIYKNNPTNKHFTYKKINTHISYISKDISSRFLKISKLENEDVFRNNNIIFAKPIVPNNLQTKPFDKFYDSSIGVQESVDKISNKQYKKNPMEGMYPGKGVFVLTQSELDQLNLSAKEMKVIKPYLDPNDVKKYAIEPKEKKYLIYSDKSTKDLIAHDSGYTNLKSHLDAHSDFITSSNKPYGLHRARKPEYFEQPKIIFKGMFVEPEFTYDDSQYYFGFSFASIIKRNKGKSLKFLLALLNSAFAKKWFYTNGKQRGAGVDVGVVKLRTFPIPDTIAVKEFDCIVDIILFLKSQEFTTANEKLMPVFFEQIIDGMVYELYFPELIKKHKRQIIPHLGELPEFSEKMSESQKMAICKEVFSRLNDKSHPVRNNLFYLDSIPEIAIIEGKHENN